MLFYLGLAFCIKGHGSVNDFSRHRITLHSLHPALDSTLGLRKFQESATLWVQGIGQVVECSSLNPLFVFLDLVGSLFYHPCGISGPFITIKVEETIELRHPAEGGSGEDLPLCVGYLAPPSIIRV